MDVIDVIMALEGGELIIHNTEEWENVKSIAEDLSHSQGFYGRLLEGMERFEECNDLEECFPIRM